MFMTHTHKTQAGTFSARVDTSFCQLMSPILHLIKSFTSTIYVTSPSLNFTSCVFTSFCLNQAASSGAEKWSQHVKLPNTAVPLIGHLRQAFRTVSGANFPPHNKCTDSKFILKVHFVEIIDSSISFSSHQYLTNWETQFVGYWCFGLVAAPNHQPKASVWQVGNLMNERMKEWMNEGMNGTFKVPTRNF